MACYLVVDGGLSVSAQSKGQLEPEMGKHVQPLSGVSDRLQNGFELVDALRESWETTFDLQG
jgi:hypothetical protein